MKKVIWLLSFFVLNNSNAQSPNHELNFIRKHNFFSLVYPVKLYANDSLIKLKNNEMVTIVFDDQLVLKKRGCLTQFKSFEFQSSSFWKVKHTFFFPFSSDKMVAITEQEFLASSEKMKRKKIVELNE